MALLLERIVATITLCVIGAVFWFGERPFGWLPILMLRIAARPNWTPVWLQKVGGDRLASVRQAIGQARRIPVRT